MSTQMVVLILGASGLNLFAILGVVWKGGNLLGGFRTSINGWGQEIEKLRTRSDHFAEVQQRTVAQLDALEGRVSRLERQQDK